MPVTITHPSYDLFYPQWQRIEDCLEGIDAIKLGAERYLPMLNAHRGDTAAYQEYQDRAVWFGAADRTISGLTGSVFRIDPKVTVPARLKPRMDNFNGRGDSLMTFAKAIVATTLSYNRCGILVDIDAPSEDALGFEVMNAPALSNDPAAGLPWAVAYDAKDIRCWRTKQINGQVIVDQVILHETVTRPAEDGFGFDLVSRLRVLELDAAGHYQIRLFEAEADTTQAIAPSINVEDAEYTLVRTINPKPTGQPIDYIPFIFLSALDLRPEIKKSPILDLVDVNLHHYRLSADYNQGLHKLGFPIPVVIGVNEMGSVWRVGADAVWELPAGCDAKMLEFMGTGLGELRTALQSDEQYMARLGAHLLEDQKKAAETAEALRIRQSGENSILASVAGTVSEGLSQVVEIMAEWAHINGKVDIALNKDFFDEQLNPQQLEALVKALQAHALPMEAFLYQLKAGEILPPDMTAEEAKTLLDNQEPTLLGSPLNLSAPAQPGAPQATQPPAAPAPAKPAVKQPAKGA